jgi:uroporphyrinogen-III synthase
MTMSSAAGSASAARAYAALDPSAPAVSIGPQTTAAAAGVDVVAEAETHDLDGLVAAVRRIVPLS